MSHFTRSLLVLALVLFLIAAIPVGSQIALASQGSFLPAAGPQPQGELLPSWIVLGLMTAAALSAGREIIFPKEKK